MLARAGRLFVIAGAATALLAESSCSAYGAPSPPSGPYVRDAGGDTDGGDAEP